MVGGAKRFSENSGFSLIELMVVVAIVAIVSAAVVPTFSDSLQKNRQREAAMLIIEGVYGARSRAARTGKCHRLRIYMSGPVVGSGDGGKVAVDEDTSRDGNCSSTAVWQRVSFKSVGNSTDPDPDVGGDAHAGLVGSDVAIADVLDLNGSSILGTANPVILLFEPSGGLSLRSAQERFFSIEAYDSSGTLRGITRHVRISPSGAVNYTSFSEFRTP